MIFRWRGTREWAVGDMESTPIFAAMFKKLFLREWLREHVRYGQEIQLANLEVIQRELAS